MQDDSKHKIDKLFCEKLQNFEVEVPNFAWEGIESDLVEKRRKKYGFILRWFAVAATWFLMFGLGYWFSQKNIPLEVARNTKNLTSIELASLGKKKNSQISVSAQSQYSQISEKTDSTESQHFSENKNLTFSQDSARQHFTEIAKRDSIIDFCKEISVDFSNTLSDSVKIKLFEKDNFTKKWRINAQAAPVFALNIRFPVQTEKNISKEMQQAITQVYPNNEAKPVAAFSYGLNVAYQFHSHWSFSAGIIYAKKSQEVERIAITKTSSSFENSYFTYNPSIGRVNFDAKNSEKIEDIRQHGTVYSKEIYAANLTVYRFDINLTQNFHYLEMPLMIRYNFLNHRVNGFVAAGASLQTLIKNSAFIHNSKSEFWSGETKNINLLNLSGNLSVGIEYSLTKHWALGIEPTLKYSFLPLSIDRKVYDYPFSLTIFSNLTYTL